MVLVLLLLSTAALAQQNFLGVNAHQPQTDVLDAAKDLGVSWVRIDLNWYQAQPTQGQAPDFTLFDKIVAEAQQRGLKVFPTVGYGPAWASEPDTDGVATNNVPKAGEYGKFCQAVAAHYSGKLTHIGLWNEPNLGGFFEGTKQQWIDRIVIEGIKGIKAGCPTCKVAGPELASIGDLYDTWLDDSLKQLKQQGLMYDVITWHIYSGFLELSPGWFCWSGDLFEHDLDQHRVCFGIHGRLSVREVLVQNGLTSLPVWITETGRTAPLSDAAATKDQLTYYRRVIEEQLERPWWTHTFFYEIVDDNLIADKWGMALRGGASYPGSYQKKPVWAFVQNVLARQPALGGSGGDCDDGLDNDGDKLIDYPSDPGCSAASDPTETAGTTPDAGSPPDAATADAPSAGDAPSPTTDLSPGADLGALDAPTASDTTPRTDSAVSAGDDGCGCQVGAGAAASGDLTPLCLGLPAAALFALRASRRHGRGRRGR